MPFSFLPSITNLHLPFAETQSSSIIGPLIVGTIADATDNIPWGILSLPGIILVAVPVVLGVDVNRARVATKVSRSSPTPVCTVFLDDTWGGTFLIADTTVLRRLVFIHVHTFTAQPTSLLGSIYG